MSRASTPVGATLCPWRGPAAPGEFRPDRAPCGREVPGVDEQRTCTPCQLGGAPHRVAYSYVVGYDARPYEVHLANAHLVDERVPDAKEEIADFDAGGVCVPPALVGSAAPIDGPPPAWEP